MSAQTGGFGRPAKNRPLISPKEDLLTYAQAAEYLGYKCVRPVYKLAASGKLAVVKLHRRSSRISKQAIQDMIDAATIQAVTTAPRTRRSVKSK